MSNLFLAEKVLRECYAAGVRDFCICAGARNSPFVFLLDKAKSGGLIYVHSFFEERSAAFFALGRAERDSRPVAVITTSGTAVAELLPAVIEAHYTGKPLMLITADRPREYRGTGAPQSIEQVGIFSNYVEKTLDIAVEEELRGLSEWSMTSPIQLNICFDEPLIDGEVETLDFSTIEPIMPHSSLYSKKDKDLCLDIELDSPLVILGSIPDISRNLVFEFLVSTALPIYVESISGLRGLLAGDARTAGRLINGGNKSITAAATRGNFKSVIRIGGVPTLRFWRDLESKHVNMSVVSISSTKYTGLARKSFHFGGFENLNKLKKQIHPSEYPGFYAVDKQYEKQIFSALEPGPFSEPNLVRKISKLLDGKSVYLGNSLPIREWDLVSDVSISLKRIFANRGANGIDGQISTFMGWAETGSENWAIVGDLTALYDLTSLWATEFLSDSKCRILVINNGGGHIFKNMFKHEAFLNRHQIQFRNWAEMWGWEYVRWIDIPSKKEISSLHEKIIIELFPNEAQTEKFWQEFDIK